MQKIGRYQILAELGRGAMGVVYSAMDPLIGRRVAIKTIRLDTMEASENREELTRRLFREAQSAGILSHPGIITIHDIGEQGDEAYIVMEYVDGKNLEDVVTSCIPQHSAMLFSILSQCAIALDFAHSKGIIHRDIKPSNIMLCHDGVVKIADFGVAKLSASGSMTQAGLVLGTPSYMSPEQAQGHVVDGRSDQFSLAVVAYRLLTGMLPFQGPTLTAILAKLILEEPQYESSSLHPYLQIVFKRALAKIPQFRFPNCTDFVRDLEGAYSLCKTEIGDGNTASAKQEPVTAEVESSAPSVVPSTEISAQQVSVPVSSESANTPKIEKVFESPEAVAPSPEMLAVTEDKPDISPVQHSSPKTQIEKQKRKSKVMLWAGSLAVVVLIVMGFLVIKTIRTHTTPAADVVRSTSDASITATPEDRLPTTQNNPTTEETSQAKPIEEVDFFETESKQAAGVLPKQAAMPKTEQPVSAPKSREGESGVITWSGKLGKNAVLVIAPPIVSVGKITGKLPGKPVSIEVEPREVTIRQMPVKANGYKQLMLYSGSNRFTSITVRWKTIP